MEETRSVLLTNEGAVFGLLLATLMFVFYTSSLKQGFWSKFYSIVPAVLMCYFVPAIFNSLGIISGEDSSIYYVSSRFLLPACLVLLTLSVDLKEIKKLGRKAVIMFLSGTVGIVLGGPIAILIVSAFSPETVGGVGPDAVWRGLATVAGSWIGGSANQAAMLEVFGASSGLFSSMIAVDVIVANIWMAFLLIGAGRSVKIDQILKADASSIEEVKTRVEKYQAEIARIPSLTDTMIILGIGFGATGVAHLMADTIYPFIEDNAPYLEKFSLTKQFFWLVVIATAIGLSLSFTKLRLYEGAGASRIGSVFIYVLIASIGMQMDITAIVDNPGLFLVGGVWMLVHITILLTTAKLVKAPFFFVAVGSQANVGGAASAPVVASAFHPSLAPVGVLLAVLGYVLGTYGAYLCGILMQAAAAV